MKWNEIRILYSNKFVLLKSLKDHIEKNKKIIGDVVLLKVIY